MPKTNFTKVEEVLEQGLRKMSIDQLFEDSAKQKGTQADKNQKKLIEAVQRDVKFLDAKKHKVLYDGLGMKRQEIRTLLDNGARLTPAEWEKVKQIKEHIDKYRREVLAQLPVSTDDRLVEQERVKHIHKRFNVNDGWLPLH
jgi:carbamoylphosphate synthase small subunit